ncbi:hypothetical protein [Pelagibacterium montanilacus]|uniref:hypothetical protein n=1 Tax=Pelagibacterium montanilacus TaxID=2185280 RepID=UPI000F8F10E1|nr:hypothetical protein [Pelagibacterium montanilacus]
MKLADRTLPLMIAALLALAVSLVWLPAGAGAFERHAQMHGSGIEEAHDPAYHDTDPGEMAGAQHPCKPCGADCCMMTQCHPGLATEPHGSLFSEPGDKVISAIGAGALSGSPDVAVPPPRILLI